MPEGLLSFSPMHPKGKPPETKEDASVQPPGSGLSLGACQRELEAARKELQSFSYSISHDLRAPLRAIDGFSRILQEDYSGSLDAEGQKYLGFVLANAQHLNRLIDDLLDYYRLGQMPLRTETVDMTELFRSIAAELRAAENPRAITMKFGDLPSAQGDFAMLRQVATQLVSNALKFSRGRNGAKIEIDHEKVEGEVVYFVRDNGLGFEMQYASKLFQVFQKLHTGDEFEGNGIGLALAHRAVTQLGGKIWASSQPGEGTTMFFSLAPVVKPAL